MKKLAWTLVFTAGFLFLIPIIAHLFWGCNYSATEYATFVGGTAGPIAALAGFLFVYINFQLQQKQIDNHDKQFERESFENTFFLMLNHYQKKQDESYVFDQLPRIWVSFFKQVEMYCKDRSIDIKDLDVEIGNRIYKEDILVGPEQGLIKAITIILQHIDSAPSLIDKGKYSEILFNRITHDEKTLIIIYSLFDRRGLNQSEFHLLAKIAKRIDKADHQYTYLNEWLPQLNIP